MNPFTEISKRTYAEKKPDFLLHFTPDSLSAINSPAPPTDELNFHLHVMKSDKKLIPLIIRGVKNGVNAGADNNASGTDEQ